MAKYVLASLDSNGQLFWTNDPFTALMHILVCTASTDVLSWIEPGSINPSTQRALACESTTDVLSWTSTLPP